jgi:beta-glucosidase
MEYCSLPIYITSNGTCDNSDRFRARFIYEHLGAISASDLPIRRYYYKSFIDGFEWHNAGIARFGLVAVDFKTMARTVKKSGEFFSTMINDRGVTDEAFEKFVAGQIYNH